MDKATAIVVISLILVFSVNLPLARAAISDPPGPYHYVVATIGEPETVDPALAYDTSSGELIMQVYETLIDFKGTSTSEFMPELASSWTVSPDGQTYTFTIRSGVLFQDGSTLTAADVEYSFERVMVRDFAGGPGWMFFEPIFGTYNAAQMGDLSTPAGATAVGQAIDAAIESSGNTVTVQFATGRAYPPFMAILAQTWASVLSQAWATAQGDWPGTGLQDGTWVSYRRPSQSPLDGPPNVMMGTGPYSLDYWTHSAEWSIVRHVNYWGTWGNPRRGFAARGYLSRITEKMVTDWATRLTGFLAGIYDSIYVPRSYISQVWRQPGVRCAYPLTAISTDAMFFNYNATRLSTYIGNGTELGFTFGETGVRPDFFTDIHIRKAIAYSINWSQYILDAYMGEAKQNAIPVPDTFKFFDASLPKYGINLTRAVEEWKQAWGGTVESPGPVWTNGLYFKLAYSEGSLPRYQLEQMLETNIEAVNPKFHIDKIGVSWPTLLSHMWYGPAGGRSIIPLYRIGWLADFPDVHNFVEPFMASWGDFSYPQSIHLDPHSSQMDNLITWGLGNTTDVGRKANYDALWQLYIQQAPSVPLVQGIGRRWERDWVQGWYYNAIFPGTNFYSMWKEELPIEDVNGDGKADIKDLATAAKAFGAYYIQPLLPPNPAGPPGTYSANWNSRVDINQDMKVDIKDLAQMAKKYGYLAPPWIPPP